MRRLALALLLAAGCSGGGAEVEPGEWLPGGATTNTLLLGSAAYTRPASNLSAEHEPAFYAGNSFFSQAWVEAPASPASRDGLGPLFNARSCAACHFKDGRGRPPAPGERFLGMLIRLSVPGQDAHGGPLPEPRYGGQLQPFAVLGVPAEGDPRVTYLEEPGSYGDGTPYSLARPRYEIAELAYGALQADVMLSPRVAPAMVGMGLLEAIPEARLRELADPGDADGDGISGRLSQVWDAATGAPAVGRFGWKAEQPSVRAQVTGAFLGDIGITTGPRPVQECSVAQAECLAAPAGGAPELADDLLDKVVLYSQTLAVPVRTRWDDAEVLRGKALFARAGCAGCHTPSHLTRADAALPELAGQRIFPYTDLLLHDLGEALSDRRPVFAAAGSEWRTAPLWGLRLIAAVNQHERLLHDGRARGVAEAILWHGGEAVAAREAFRMMAADERAALLAFVGSL